MFTVVNMVVEVSRRHDRHDEIRENGRLYFGARGQVGNLGGIDIDPYPVAHIEFVDLLADIEDGQAGIDGIAVENSGGTVANDHTNAFVFEKLGCVSRRGTSVIGTAHPNIVFLTFLGEFGNKDFSDMFHE